MKKMDEMDRNIRLRSEELGFKAAVLILAVWVLKAGAIFQVMVYRIRFPCWCWQQFYAFRDFLRC